MVDSGNIVSRSTVGTTSTRHLVVSLLETLYLSKLQSTLVISTSVISNNRLSRRENLIPV